MTHRTPLWLMALAPLLLSVLLALPAWASTYGQVDTEDIRDNAITDAEVDWGTSAGQVNAADVLIIDAPDDFTATTVEAALAELFGALGSIGSTEYWQELVAAGIIRPLTAGRDVYLGDNEQLILESDTGTEGKINVGDPDDSYYKFHLNADGSLNWGGGSAATDAALSRRGVSALTLGETGLRLLFSDHYVLDVGRGITGESRNAAIEGISYETSQAVFRGWLEDDAETDTDNHAGEFERVDAGPWLDLDAEVEGSHAPAPGGDKCRVYSTDLSLTANQHVFSRLNSDDAVDLVTPVVYQVSGAELAVGAKGTRWTYATATGATGPATVTPTQQCGVDFTNHYFSYNVGLFAWTSTASGGFPATLALQSNVGTGLDFAKNLLGTYPAGLQNSSVVLVRARVMVNNTSRLASLYLTLNDVGATNNTPANGASANVLGSLTGGQWTEVTLAVAGTDVSSWGDNLRAGLLAYGTTTPANVGRTEVYVDWLRAEVLPY